MTPREPVAFISYVRSDDDHDSGRISELRLRLEGEVKMQTGRPFHIFQDRNDITWGQQWKSRIEDAIFDVTFLIPIITPSYFQSEACKAEFKSFLIRENTLGENRLILPIYYVYCDEMDDELAAGNEIAAILRARNWVDWRGFRFESLASSALRAEIASLGSTIKKTMKELKVILSASESVGASSSKIIKGDTKEFFSKFTDITYVPFVPIARGKRFSKKSILESSKNPYYAYTDKFDEVIAPSALASPSDMMKMHSLLLKVLRKEVSRCEEQLAIFMEYLGKTDNLEKLSVQFLVDNSGSMRGDKITGVACWMSMIANILSHMGVSVEVLGFTTRAWKGGGSRELWIKDRKPVQPGRLNDLRHIVYKSFDQTIQEADTNFGVMLREGILKENVDGEALLWAYSRIRLDKNLRKIIFVISDGAPVDDSTLSVSTANFLGDHLLSTIEWMRLKTDIELYGIGLGYSVSRYYGDGSPTLDEKEIGPDLLKVVALALGGNWNEAAEIQRETTPIEVQLDDEEADENYESEVPEDNIEKN